MSFWAPSPRFFLCASTPFAPVPAPAHGHGVPGCTRSGKLRKPSPVPRPDSLDRFARSEPPRPRPRTCAQVSAWSNSLVETVWHARTPCDSSLPQVCGADAREIEHGCDFGRVALEPLPVALPSLSSPSTRSACRELGLGFAASQRLAVSHGLPMHAGLLVMLDLTWARGSRPSTCTEDLSACANFGQTLHARRRCTGLMHPTGREWL